MIAARLGRILNHRHESLVLKAVESRGRWEGAINHRSLLEKLLLWLGMQGHLLTSEH